MPTVLPFSSTPVNELRFHCPARRLASAAGMLPGRGQQQGHRVLGGRDDVRGGRVDHHHAARGGRRHVDVVQPDPGPRHHLEPGRRGRAPRRRPWWPSGPAARRRRRARPAARAGRCRRRGGSRRRRRAGRPRTVRASRRAGRQGGWRRCSRRLRAPESATADLTDRSCAAPAVAGTPVPGRALAAHPDTSAASGAPSDPPTPPAEPGAAGQVALVPTQLIRPRSRSPTCSIGCSAPSFCSRVKLGRPASSSATHSRAKRAVLDLGRGSCASRP